jgi:uncharacterized repeat protein (TIGR03803 family)
VRDSAGNLYGTTAVGGAFLMGTVFKLDTSGAMTILHSFNGPDGAGPYSRLVRDTAGNLYGTTLRGGSNADGTVFKLDPAGNEVVLYNFAGTPDGEAPFGSLVRDSTGNVYGTTYLGGAYGFGTVFKVDPTGAETVLYSFTGLADGGLPWAGVVRDAAGNLYGTTVSGGDLTCFPPAGCGTVFKLDAAGNETVLHSFGPSFSGDGNFPVGRLMRDAAGNLFGTAQNGGAYGQGTIFKLKP